MLPISIGLLDAIGAAAAASTLLAFAQKNMLPMRLSAISANLLFIGYGGLGSFYPVLVLHLILLPLNIGRLVQCFRENGAAGSPSLIDEWRHRGG